MKQISVADLFLKRASSLKTSDVKEKGDYPVFGAQGIIGYRDDYQTASKALSVIKDGAGVGRIGIIPEKSSVLGTIQILMPKENCDLEYGYYLLKSLNLGRNYVGSAIPHIYFKDYGKKKVQDRAIKEQVKISSLLSKLEEELNIAKRELLYFGELIKSRFIERKETDYAA